MSISIVRLSSGEELIANIKDEFIEGWKKNSDKVRLEKPAILVPQKNKETGQTSLALVPWIPYIEHEADGMTMSGNAIMYIETPVIDLVNVYNTQFGSGLVLPANAGTKAKKIITGPTLVTD